MNDNKEKAQQELTNDVNSNRRRTTLDEDYKPVKISESADASANNFKPSSLKLES